MTFLNTLHEQMTGITETNNVLCLIRDERDQQDRKWGQQDHPYTATMVGPVARDHERHAEFWKRENDVRVREMDLAWDGILLEEVYEALAETDAEAREVELIQVAAVAVAMVEASRRKRLVFHRERLQQWLNPPLSWTFEASEISPEALRILHGDASNNAA